MRAVLGLKLNPWHDTGAAVVVEKDADLRVVTISQERLDRVKNSRAFPREAIDFCLGEADCRTKGLDLIVADYIVQPEIDDRFMGGDPHLDRKVEFFKNVETLGIPVMFAEHHLCHAASAYLATDWTDALGLVIDGHGSGYETQTIFDCAGTSITKLASSHRPGIGWMYTVATETLLGFAHLQEGKTMGLAGWTGDAGPWQRAFDSTPSPGAPLATHYPQFADTVSKPWWQLCAAADMPRRQPADDPTADPFVKYAFAAQAELERGIMQVARYARSLSPRKRLCYAGGAALNILANRLLLDSGLFGDLFIQPAASDTGIPLGAALLGYYTALGGTRRWQMPHAFLARGYADAETAAAAAWKGHRSPYRVEDMARILSHDYLAGWFAGASEFGPRALGHRSILCCPGHPQMKAYLNKEVKHREMFRPFAPIVPEERQAEFFDLRTPSPYMLLNATVRRDKAGLIPAVVHADGTARVQSIPRTSQPELHALLEEVARVTGVPVLLNTSLNLAGEPIVETPDEAVDLFSRSRLDVLVLGSQILTKNPLETLLALPNPGLPR
ncbi:MAG: carbamoyltransferase C-terminal domain-containing protein, partial [Vicinamibacterales bacterium]